MARTGQDPPHFLQVSPRFCHLRQDTTSPWQWHLGVFISLPSFFDNYLWEMGAEGTKKWVVERPVRPAIHFATLHLQMGGKSAEKSLRLLWPWRKGSRFTARGASGGSSAPGRKAEWGGEEKKFLFWRGVLEYQRNSWSAKKVFNYCEGRRTWAWGGR